MGVCWSTNPSDLPNNFEQNFSSHCTLSFSRKCFLTEKSWNLHVRIIPPSHHFLYYDFFDIFGFQWSSMFLIFFLWCPNINSYVLIDGRGHFKLYLPPLEEELCIKTKKNVRILKVQIFEFFLYLILVYSQNYIKNFKSDLMVISLTIQLP